MSDLINAAQALLAGPGDPFDNNFALEELRAALAALPPDPVVLSRKDAEGALKVVKVLLELKELQKLTATTENELRYVCNEVLLEPDQALTQKGMHLRIRARIVKQRDAAQERVKLLEAALRELIDCKDIHDAIEQAQATPSTMGPATLTVLQDDYKRRKPLAWNAAREVMKEATP